MAESFEYRLRWQRVGRQPTSRIMQTERGVVGKAERLLALDEDKHIDGDDGPNPYRTMPDLVTLTIEKRPVGAWELARTFDVPEPDPESGDFEDDPNAGIEPYNGVPF